MISPHGRPLAPSARAKEIRSPERRDARLDTPGAAVPGGPSARDEARFAGEVLDGIGGVRHLSLRNALGGPVDFLGATDGGGAPGGRGILTHQDQRTRVCGEVRGGELRGPALVLQGRHGWYHGPLANREGLLCPRPRDQVEGIGRTGVTDVGDIRNGRAYPTKGDAGRTIDYPPDLVDIFTLSPLEDAALATDGLAYDFTSSAKMLSEQGSFRNSRGDTVSALSARDRPIEALVLMLKRGGDADRAILNLGGLEVGAPPADLPWPLNDPVRGVPMLEPELDLAEGLTRDRAFQDLERHLQKQPDGPAPNHQADFTLQRLLLSSIALHSVHAQSGGDPGGITLPPDWSYGDVSATKVDWRLALAACANHPKIRALVGFGWAFRGIASRWGALTLFATRAGETIAPVSPFSGLLRCAYAGVFANGRPTGRGRMVWESRTKHLGAWDPSLEIIGHFEDGAPHGDCLLRWACGTSLRGHFARGALCVGDGANTAIRWRDGRWVSGRLDPAKLSGVRAAFAVTGDCAPVEWDDELLLPGSGAQAEDRAEWPTTPRAGRSQRSFGMLGSTHVRHELRPKSVVTIEDRRVYRGDIENGVPHGFGRMEGDRWSYEGNWTHGLPEHAEGECAFTREWADGRLVSYRGTLVAKEQEDALTLSKVWLLTGQGTLTLPDGEPMPHHLIGQPLHLALNEATHEPRRSTGLWWRR